MVYLQTCSSHSQQLRGWLVSQEVVMGGEKYSPENLFAAANTSSAQAGPELTWQGDILRKQTDPAPPVNIPPQE